MVSIEKDEDFSGYELIEPGNNQLFVLAEHWHNIGKVPRATMKLLKYLHQEANVRILAIEQGTSVAQMINGYLKSGDTVRLRQIARNTLFWGKENWEFFEDLRDFNLSVSPEEQITVASIDIEYKMASALFMINEWIGDREIPKELDGTVGGFYRLFEELRPHREQFQGIAVMYYYDREIVENLVLATIDELEKKSTIYMDYFGEHFVDFATMILEMDDGLTFDFINPNTNYKFRDRLIYKKFIKLITENPDKGILCPIGMRHATKGSSIRKLDELAFSPLLDKVMVIKVSALSNKMIISGDLRRFNFNYPFLLRAQPATLIKHDEQDPILKSSKEFDFTLFINDNEDLTPFEKVYKREF